VTALAQLSESQPGVLRSKTPPRTAVKGTMRKKLSFMMYRIIWVWTLKVSDSRLEDDGGMKETKHDFQGRISFSLCKFTTFRVFSEIEILSSALKLPGITKATNSAGVATKSIT
jgi:hypothetical protein